MEDVPYDSPTKTSKNLFRGRSLSSLASRQFSVMEVVKKRESVVQHIIRSSPMRGGSRRRKRLQPSSKKLKSAG